MPARIELRRKYWREEREMSPSPDGHPRLHLRRFVCLLCEGDPYVIEHTKVQHGDNGIEARSRMDRHVLSHLKARNLERNEKGAETDGN